MKLKNTDEKRLLSEKITSDVSKILKIKSQSSFKNSINKLIILFDSDRYSVERLEDITAIKLYKNDHKYLSFSIDNNAGTQTHITEDFSFLSSYSIDDVEE